VAAFAVEVDVLVLEGAFVVAMAGFVAQGAAAVLDGVNGMVVEQEGEGAKDGAALGGGHAVFEFAQGEGPMGLLEFLIDE